MHRSDDERQRGPCTDHERGTTGMMLAPGQVVLTSSGRKTTPFPVFDTSTRRKTSKSLAAVEQWLITNALTEARELKDRFNERQFEAVISRNISQSDKDSAEEYLFGQQPAVVHRMQNIQNGAAD